MVGARVSRALDSRIIGRNYLTSRINWVVQSTAVDYLHLLLVAVHWLFAVMDIKATATYILHRFFSLAMDTYLMLLIGTAGRVAT